MGKKGGHALSAARFSFRPAPLGTLFVGYTYSIGKDCFHMSLRRQNKSYSEAIELCLIEKLFFLLFYKICIAANLRGPYSLAYNLTLGRGNRYKVWQVSLKRVEKKNRIFSKGHHSEFLIPQMTQEIQNF